MNAIDSLLAKDENLEKASKSLKAMAHPLRLKILCVLRDGEMSVLDIVGRVKSSQSNVSQHIDILRNKNIISSRRSSNKILCKVKDTKILELIAVMKNIFCDTDID